jgi:hypothetical protein
MRVTVEYLVERTTIAGETEVLGENLPQRHFIPPQIPHDHVRFRTPDRSGKLVLTGLLMARILCTANAAEPGFPDTFAKIASSEKIIRNE